MSRVSPACVILLSFLSSVAHATDGVVEINQTCAVNTGCLPGDAAGFPVTIGESGSYRLTGDLVVPTAGTTAIDVTTSDVTIDFNGFGVFGPTVCTRLVRTGRGATAPRQSLGDSLSG